MTPSPLGRRGRWASSLTALTLLACARGAPGPEPGPAPDGTGHASDLEPVPTGRPTPARLREAPIHPAWVIIGAVSGPSMNQLSIEEELAAVEELLGADRGILLYAGGPRSRGVLAKNSPPSAPHPSAPSPGPAARAPRAALLERLAPLLGATTLADSHFRPLSVSPHEAATRARILEALTRALRASGDRLVVWLAGHGHEVAEPWDAVVSTWGGARFANADLADLFTLEGAVRPLHLIATQCYGGGFADALVDRPDLGCGAFAAIWSLPASGCDPAPDAPRTSYGVHLRRALSGELRTPDLDGDGQVGLSEAHVGAVLSLDGIDVPTLSSQYLLGRAVGLSEVGEPDPDVDELLPDELLEERHLVDSLLARLGVTLHTFDQAYSEASEQWSTLLEDNTWQRDELSQAEGEARGALLARWPELEDPWRPDFSRTLEREGEAILRFLDESPELAVWLHALEVRDQHLEAEYRAELAVRSFERVTVPLTTLRFAVKAFENPEIHRRFWMLRHCERSPVPMRRP